MGSFVTAMSAGAVSYTHLDVYKRQGYIGMELGQLFHHLGSEITLMQRSERLLKEYDPEISESVEKALIEQGINLSLIHIFYWLHNSNSIRNW